ncbi:tetratricopeptide repeat protein [Bacterioplanoides sp. SCSIO 12839]|uniref:tetratricopeptide repeat protein n=1 Tax=Bacterioplanoides sp. SCSIO 12839 TaxID=2829569 RepID=UPI0021027B01|nr:tetratricopeptide repeat protein [Bacterioplanoides sp. SCSIO 12839]UTW48350.1 tetratricopeptide repeat protein [Bacterioplanoides sp. SCSIO 12839]
MKAILQSLLFVLVFSVCGSVTAQAQVETQTQDSKQHPSVEINSIVLHQLFDLQDRVNRLEYSQSATDSVEQNKEIELLKQQLNQLTQSVNLQHGKLSNQVDQYEGRISDIGAGVDRYTSVLGWFGIVAGLFAVVITLIALLFSSQSKKLAVEAAKEQLEIHSEEIKSDLSEQLKNEINLHREKWEEHITNLLMDSEKRIEDLEQKIKKILNESHDYLERIKKLAQKAIEKELTEEEKEEYQISTFKLRQKPESEFTPDDWYQLGVDEYTRNNYPKAIEYFELSELHIDAKDIDVAMSLFAKAFCLNQDNRPDEEITIYDDLIARYSESEQSELLELVAKSLLNKGARLGKQNRSNEALAVYNDLILRYGKSDKPELQNQVAMSLLNKGFVLGLQNRPDEELAAYDDVISRYGKSERPRMQDLIAKALLGKGFALGLQNRPYEELAAYDDVITRYGKSELPDLQEKVAASLFNKGVRLGQQNDLNKEIAAYDELISSFDESEQLEIQKHIASALLNKGIALGRQNQPDEELVAYNELINRFNDSEQLEIQKQIASALFNKGIALGKQNQLDEAISSYDNLISRYGEHDSLELKELVAQALNNTGAMLSQQNRLDEAFVIFEELITRYEESEEDGLKNSITFALSNIAELSLLLESPDSSEQRIHKVLDRSSSNSFTSSVMKFLLFLLDKADISQMLQNIEQLPEDTKFTWGFNEIRDYLNQFSGVKGEQAQAVVRFFEEHHNVEKLKEELDEIKGDK